MVVGRLVNTLHKITNTSGINFAKTHYFEFWCFPEYRKFENFVGRGHNSVSQWVSKYLWGDIEFYITVPKILRGKLQFCFSVENFDRWITILSHSIENLGSWITILFDSDEKFVEYPLVHQSFLNLATVFLLNVLFRELFDLGYFVLTPLII